jgi:hypothetical protein
VYPVTEAVVNELSDAANTINGTPAAPNRGNTWILSVLLMGLVILLCLVAGELVLRQWFPVGSSLLQRDSRLLYKYIPGSRKQKFPLPGSGAPTVLVTINREGRRGDLFSAASRPRIVVYGDSFIAGEGTPLKQTFVYQLKQLLSTKLSHPVQVLNAGVLGYGPDQESLVMEDEIGSLKPDLVIFAIYSGNDFGDLMRNKLFRLDEHQKLVAGHPVLSAGLNRQFAGIERQTPYQLVRRVRDTLDVIRNSAIARKIKSLIRPARDSGKGAARPAPPEPGNTELLRTWLSYHEDEYKNLVVEQDNQVYNLFLDHYDDDVNLYPHSEPSLYKRVFMERMMERIQQIASSHGVPLLFLIIPAAYDVVDKWDVSIDTRVFPEYRRSELTDVLEQIAQKNGSMYLNLFDLFRGHQGEDIYYHKGDDHWNTRGQQLAAGRTEEYIVGNRLLRPVR